MRWFEAAVLLPSGVSAALNLRQYRPEVAETVLPFQAEFQADAAQQNVVNAQKAPKFLTERTRSFAVNGTAIPNVDFDVGESYAGLLPISGNSTAKEKLYFWFFPSESDQADKEILIWLTGGPGCSSTGELLSENGPMLWQPGTFKPIRNKWSWHRLTNVVWIDQPVGAGFSQGTPTARDEFDVARQFLGFWRNFVDTFALRGYKVYVTGSSYSGMYCPYIASAMLDQNDTTFFDVAGMQIFDGVYAVDGITEQVPTAAFADRWEHVFNFNDTVRKAIKDMDQKCGYGDYMRKYLAYPPAGVQPTLPPGVDQQGRTTRECDVWGMVYSAAAELNPCFSVYTVTNLCPFRFDPLGFTEGTMFMPAAAGTPYFNRLDVKRAINAPQDQEWAFCTNTPVFVNGTDGSLLAGPGSQPVLPNVIDRTRNVILAHGTRDFVLVDDGTLLAIQNLTWGGKLGFQTKPAAPLYVPHSSNNSNPENWAGAGVVGTVHSERGLTYLSVAAAGHFVSEDAPAVAFRSVEVLLGRRDGFASTAPFTFDAGGNGNASIASPVTSDLGAGTVLMYPQSLQPGRLSTSGKARLVGGKEQAMLAFGIAVVAAVLMGL